MSNPMVEHKAESYYDAAVGGYGWRCSCGEGSRPVFPQHAAKSIAADHSGVRPATPVTGRERSTKISDPHAIPDELRRAAALMRERAEAANSADARRPYGDRSVDPVPETEWGALVDNYLGGEIGVHCAAWTPTAALAVAAWLEIGANPYACVDSAPMLAVARAYMAAGDTRG